MAQPIGDLLPAAFALNEPAVATPASAAPPADMSADIPADVPTGTSPAAAVRQEASEAVDLATPTFGASRVELRRVVHPLVGQLDNLARLDLEVFGHTGLRAEDLSVVSRAGAVYEGVVGGRLVGSCQLLRVFDDPAAAWVVGFYVLPEFRGKGLGRELLTEVAAEAGRAGLRRLLLTVGADNLPALELYLSFGFLRVETIPDFYGPGEDRLLLRCELGRSGRDVGRASGAERDAASGLGSGAGS